MALSVSTNRDYNDDILHSGKVYMLCSSHFKGDVCPKC
jgi:hypothetical protein